MREEAFCFILSSHDHWVNSKQFSLDRLGSRTQLVAKLCNIDSPMAQAEFQILCDSVETKNDDLQLHGNVLVQGGGIRATCDRVTVHLRSARIDFAGQVQLVPDSAPSGGTLRGEHFIWSMTSTPTLSPAVLGVPK
jgi:hypothetical protein